MSRSRGCCISRSCGPRIAHARIRRIDRTGALAVPGVVAVYTFEDVPKRRFSSALHEDHLVDPDDTFMLDDVARFAGQRIAAVVAESEGAAEAGCRALEVDYEILPAVFDPEAAMAPGAPILHHKDEVVGGGTNIFCNLKGEIGSVAEGFAAGRRRARADLFHDPRAACPSRDARFDRLAGRRRPLARAHQLARAVHRPEEARLPDGHSGPRPARLHRAGRRRLRRKAGDGLRGSPALRRHEAWPAGEVGMDA